MLLASCSSEIEDNTPAMQARLNDSLFFKATDVRAFYTDTGDLIVRGTTDAETLSIKVRSTTGLQGFGECCFLNVGAFTDIDGRLFSTNPDGDGLARFRINPDNSISGTFKLTTKRGAFGNRVFSEGIFYEVPIENNDADDPNDPDAVEDSFSARVNTVSFNPTITAAAISGGNLSLVGETSNASIRLDFPSNTGPGMYDFASTGAFVGVYRVMDTDYPSQSGVLNIISNDTESRVIMGEFTFETGDFSVTDGRFTLNY